jgi:hypothetical protein
MICWQELIVILFNCIESEHTTQDHCSGDAVEMAGSAGNNGERNTHLPPIRRKALQPDSVRDGFSSETVQAFTQTGARLNV